MKKVFVTGFTGQDGSYLAEFLLNKGYDFIAKTDINMGLKKQLNGIEKIVI